MADPKLPYRPAWESLLGHETPEWLLDAKFGLYAHWGLYAVPAFGNEWYAKRMYDPDSPVFAEHRRRFGPQSQFGYKDFVPQFTAERYDPDAWAELYARSGARIGGFSLVHHDSFGLWDSEVTRWCAGRMGPKRDLYGQLVEALRRRGLRTVAPFHLVRCFDWYLPGHVTFGKAQDDEHVRRGIEEGWDLFDPACADLYWNHYTGRFEDFIRFWRNCVVEVIDKYRPDLIWFDGGKFQQPETEPYALEVLAHFLNRAAGWGKGVQVLNKLPVSMQFNFPREFGTWTFEAGRDRPAVVGRPWLDDMRIGSGSWGYVEGQEYVPAGTIVRGLIDRVSRGGGLLVSLSPKADGTIPQGQVETLEGVGAWLGTCGEAIYGTRPWKVAGEGDVGKLITRGGAHPHWTFENAGAEDIRYTQSKDGRCVYALTLGRPEGDVAFTLLGKAAGLLGGPVRSVRRLGGDAEAAWTWAENALIVRGEELPAGAPAFAWRMDLSAGQLGP
ncbi:MAG TPA: alpha-L-fucosidase [Phycisphaerae bacterium]|nr:alpha-L-fucosidase [Phycisphaerae bacterium]